MLWKAKTQALRVWSKEMFADWKGGRLEFILRNYRVQTSLTSRKGGNGSGKKWLMNQRGTDFDIYLCCCVHHFLLQKKYSFEWIYHSLVNHLPVHGNISGFSLWRYDKESCYEQSCTNLWMDTCFDFSWVMLWSERLNHKLSLLVDSTGLSKSPFL